MSLVFEIELGGNAPAANFGVVVLVGAHGRRIGWHVRRGEQQIVQGAFGGLTLFGKSGDLLVDGAYLVFGSFRLVLLALRHHLADGFRGGIALRLQRLLFGDDRAARLVEFGETRGIP